MNVSAQEVNRAIALDIKVCLMTQSEAADVLGFKNVRSLSNILSSKKYMSIKQARRFSEHFGYNMDFLTKGEGSLKSITTLRRTFCSEDIEDLAAFAKRAVEIVSMIADITDSQNLMELWANMNGQLNSYLEARILLEEDENHLTTNAIKKRKSYQTVIYQARQEGSLMKFAQEHGKQSRLGTQ